MSYDPKLRTAMTEIEAVLKRHDIGGMFALASRSHIEFKMTLEPSWSLVRFIRNGDAFHVKIHHSKQPQLDQTAGMIFSFMDIAGMFFGQLEQITRLIRSHSRVNHKPLTTDQITNEDRVEPPPADIISMRPNTDDEERN